MRHGLVCKRNHFLRLMVKFGIVVLALSPFMLQAQFNDPTLPPSFSNAVSQDEEINTAWVLSSVLVSAQRKVAIINGQSVQVGDVVDGANIQSINATNVKLKHRGEIIILELYPVTVKTISK